MVEFRNQTLQGKHPFFYRRSFKSISHKILYTTQSLYLSPEEAAKIWLEELWVLQETFKQNETNRKATAMLIEDPMVWPAAKRVKSPEEAHALFKDTYHEEPWHQTIDWGWVFGGIDEKVQNER